MIIRFSRQEVADLVLKRAHEVYEKIGGGSDIVAHIYRDDVTGDMVYEVGPIEEVE